MSALECKPCRDAKEARAKWGDAERTIREAADRFGFDSADDYEAWAVLDGKRRATLTLRAAQDTGKFVEREAEVSDGLSGLAGGSIAREVLRFARAGVGRLRKLLDIAVGHWSSPSINASGPESRDASEPIVGDASGVVLPQPAPDAPSGTAS